MPLAKMGAAELALLNNFLWNEVWTFRNAAGTAKGSGMPSRLMKFHAICGLGIGWAVGLLYLFHEMLHWNLYLANLLAIGLVTMWNFGLNAALNRRIFRPDANKLNNQGRHMESIFGN